MPRGRFLSKTISLDEKVNSLPNDTARLLFTWLIPHLDCEGRLHGDAQTVKSIVFPRRSIQTRKVEEYLKKLEENGLIVRYSVNGNTYLVAPNFEKHQVGLQKSKEAQSQIPPFTPELLQSSSIITPPQVKGKAKAKVEDIYIYLFNTWNNHGITQHKKLTNDMKRAIDSARIDYSQEDIEQAIKNYAEIVKSAEYYFNHKWTMAEFLSRRKGNNIERFLDLVTAKSNFKKENRNGAHRQNPRQIPRPEDYTKPSELG